MAHHVYKTVSEKLVEFAEEALAHFRTRGYVVARERRELGFPYTPTLVCRRQHTRIIVELFEKILIERIDQWVAYARSSNRDIRIAICLPPTAGMTQEDEKSMRAKKVGVYVATGTGLVERIPPEDLGLTLQLPPLATLPRKIQMALGPAYEQYERTQWRECFEEACKSFENEVRNYLLSGSTAGRIVVATRKGPKALTRRQINKMTLGQMANVFSQIQYQSHTDRVVEETLRRINRDRVNVVHHKTKKRTESRLRANVGQHLWAIVAAMKEMA